MRESDFPPLRRSKPSIRPAAGARNVGGNPGVDEAVHEKLHYFRGDVNAIGDDVGCEMFIGERLAQDAGLAMIEWTHGIESVRRMARASFHRGPGGFH